MQPAFFYIPVLNSSADSFALEEEASHHIVQVLRMKEGEPVHLTDGKGNLLKAVILEAHKKKCVVSKKEVTYKEPDPREISIALSLLKNASRFEWFLEKATELGITAIFPMLCHRTEKQQFRLQRMNNILVSAMLQSQQVWLPVLREPAAFDSVIKTSAQDQKFIAHCLPAAKRELSDMINTVLSSQIILIGPEGDFTESEIETALRHRFCAVTLGEHRLRAETAAVAAASVLKLI